MGKLSFTFSYRGFAKQLYASGRDLADIPCRLDLRNCKRCDILSPFACCCFFGIGKGKELEENKIKGESTELLTIGPYYLDNDSRDEEED